MLKYIVLLLSLVALLLTKAESNMNIRRGSLNSHCHKHSVKLLPLREKKLTNCLSRLVDYDIPSQQQKKEQLTFVTNSHSEVFKIRGGSYTRQGRKTTTSEWIINVGVNVSISYIILYFIILNCGPVQTITCMNWAIFILWCLSRFFHHYFILAGENYFGEEIISSSSSSIPTEKVRVKRGQSFIFPSDKILVDCDNGWTLNQRQSIFDYRTSGIRMKYLLRSRKDSVTLTFMTVDNFLDAVEKVNKENIIPYLFRRNGDLTHHELSRWDLSKAVARSETAKICGKEIASDPCNFGQDMILMNWNNGLSKYKYKKIFNPVLSRTLKKKILQERSTTVSLKFVPAEEYRKTLLKVHNCKLSHPAAVFLKFMTSNFLTPQKWREWRKHPVTLFGGAFSHMDTTHISSNMAVFQAFSKDLIKKLGASRFTHLYLFCIMSSNAVDFLWEHFGPSYLHNGAKYGLGASGAISGMIAATMCNMSKKRAGSYKSIQILKNTMVTPHEALIFHIASDLAGLLKMEELWKAFQYFLNDDLETAIHYIRREKSEGNEDDDGGDESQRLVGYSSHLGGYFGGILFHFLVH